MDSDCLLLFNTHNQFKLCHTFAINKQLDPKKFKVFDYVFNLTEQLLVSQIKRNKGV